MHVHMQMPNYAHLSNTPPIFDDNVIGYAKGSELLYKTVDDITVNYLPVSFSLSAIIVLGLSTTLLATIIKSIETTSKGKPKLYYHFWSTVALIIGGVWGRHEVWHIPNPAPVIFLTESMACACYVMYSRRRQRKQLFSAPLSECCCNNKCRLVWSWLMTIIGFFFTLSFVFYLLYVLPTIMLVYYLNPTRTLICVPFIISALFYTIALESLVLYQFEKITVYLAVRVCYGTDHDLMTDEEECEERNADHNGYGSLQDNPHGSRSMMESHESTELVTPKRSRSVTRNHAVQQHLTCTHIFNAQLRQNEQQHNYNINYYKKKIKEDMKISGLLCALTALVQLVASALILAVYVYGALLLTKVVFKQSSDTDNSSLLALLPTVILSVVTWFGRSLIFDVREDITDSELNIPYFRKKETTEQKILKALTDLVELHRRQENTGVEVNGRRRVGGEDREGQGNMLRTQELPE